MLRISPLRSALDGNFCHIAQQVMYYKLIFKVLCKSVLFWSVRSRGADTGPIFTEFSVIFEVFAVFRRGTEEFSDPEQNHDFGVWKCGGDAKIARFSAVCNSCN